MTLFIKLTALVAVVALTQLSVFAQSYRAPTREFYRSQYAPQADTGYVPVTRPAFSAYDDYGRPNPDAFDWTGFSLGGGLGTLGFQAEAAYYLLDWLNIRGGAHIFSLTYKDTIDGVDYDFDIGFNGFGLMLDFYPGQKRGMRLTLGGSFNDHSVDVKGKARVGGKTYKGTADYDSFAPYLGLGFGNPVQPDSAITFTFDIGFMIQGYDLSIPKDAEPVRDDIEDFLDKLELYPVIMFGLHYHF
jgi:hypothetical protein